MVRWLFQHGVLPLYTPLSGSWLNMAEALQRIVVGRALAGQHPQSESEIRFLGNPRARPFAPLTATRLNSLCQCR